MRREIAWHVILVIWVPCRNGIKRAVHLIAFRPRSRWIDTRPFDHCEDDEWFGGPITYTRSRIQSRCAKRIEDFIPQCVHGDHFSVSSGPRKVELFGLANAH